jgi:hypothetical protein
MTSVCCVCGEVLTALIEGTEADGLISHGLCQKCLDVEQKKLKDLDRYSGNLQWAGWVTSR